MKEEIENRKGYGAKPRPRVMSCSRVKSVIVQPARSLLFLSGELVKSNESEGEGS